MLKPQWLTPSTVPSTPLGGSRCSSRSLLRWTTISWMTARWNPLYGKKKRCCYCIREFNFSEICVDALEFYRWNCRWQELSLELLWIWLLFDPLILNPFWLEYEAVFVSDWGKTASHINGFQKLCKGRFWGKNLNKRGAATIGMSYLVKYYHCFAGKQQFCWTFCKIQLSAQFVDILVIKYQHPEWYRCLLDKQCGDISVLYHIFFSVLYAVIFCVYISQRVLYTDTNIFVIDQCLLIIPALVKLQSSFHICLYSLVQTPLIPIILNWSVQSFPTVPWMESELCSNPVLVRRQQYD